MITIGLGMAGTIISTAQVMVGDGTIGMDQVMDGDGIAGTDLVMAIMAGAGTTITVATTDITITTMYTIAELEALLLEVMVTDLL